MPGKALQGPVVGKPALLKTVGDSAPPLVRQLAAQEILQELAVAWLTALGLAQKILDRFSCVAKLQRIAELMQFSKHRLFPSRLLFPDRARKALSRLERPRPPAGQRP